MRTREFDKDEVMMQVMTVFWRKGFIDTSIDDLTKATHVSRSGLYGEFHNKKGLFLEAAKTYEKVVVDSVIGSIENKGLGLDGIQLVFEKVLAASAKGNERLGCLICNASSEVSRYDNEIAAVVTKFHKRVREAFFQCLKVAQKRNELHASVDISVKADFLLGAFQGLAHAIRSPMSTGALANYVAGVLAAVTLNNVTKKALK